MAPPTYAVQPLPPLSCLASGNILSPYVCLTDTYGDTIGSLYYQPYTFYFFCVHNNLHSYIRFIYIILLSLLKASFIPPVSFISPILQPLFLLVLFQDPLLAFWYSSSWLLCQLHLFYYDVL